MACTMGMIAALRLLPWELCLPGSRLDINDDAKLNAVELGKYPNLMFLLGKA
ncbi:MAG: hypothetical protein O2922_05555 [Cyanobacteria bacterium]|nr:hypothetical protein [Cyanobacteriota bacterium]